MHNQFPPSFRVKCNLGDTYHEHQRAVQDCVDSSASHMHCPADLQAASFQALQIANIFRNLNVMTPDPRLITREFECPRRWCDPNIAQKNFALLHSKAFAQFCRVYNGIKNWPAATERLAQWLAVTNESAQIVISQMKQYFLSAPIINNNNNAALTATETVKPTEELPIPPNITQIQAFAPRYFLGYQPVAGVEVTVMDLQGNSSRLQVNSRVPLKPVVWQTRDSNFLGLIGKEAIYTYQFDNPDLINDLNATRFSMITTPRTASLACFFLFQNDMHLAAGGSFFKVYKYESKEQRPYWVEIPGFTVDNTQVSAIDFGLDDRLVRTEGSTISITNINTSITTVFEHEEGEITDCKVGKDFVIVSGKNCVVLYKWEKEDASKSDTLEIFWQQRTLSVIGLGFQGPFAYYVEQDVVHLLDLRGVQEPFSYDSTEVSSTETDQDVLMEEYSWVIDPHQHRHATMDIAENYTVTGVSSIDRHLLLAGTDQKLHVIEFP